MKTYLLALLIGILGTTQLVAQNWQPFKPGESFLYKHAATFPERTVRIDSVTTDGGDSIWHFNRLFVLLPSYLARVDGPNLGGRSLRILGNGQYLFTDSTRIFLNTWAHLGDTCLRDSLQPNHVGIVTRIAQDFVLGEVDSIKVIVIAPDTMVISKNHGIVKWPGILGGTSFSLVGIQERHLGDTLPGFNGFFQFRVGDEYYWRASWGVNDGGTGYGDEFQAKVSIADVQRDSVGLHLYYRAAIQKTNDHPYQVQGYVQWGYWHIPDIKTGLVRKGHFDAVQLMGVLAPYFPPFFPDEYVAGIFCGYLNPDNDYWVRSEYSQVYDTTKLSLGPYYGWDSHIFMQQSPISTLCTPEFNGETQSAEFVEGLGFVGQHSSGFEHGSSAYMVGHIINGDTVGTIYDESYLLGNQSAQNPVDWAIFPNPAQDAITVHLPNATAGKLQLRDLLGHIVLPEQTVLDGDRIVLRDVPAGMYSLELRIGPRTDVKRIHILR